MNWLYLDFCTASSPSLIPPFLEALGTRLCQIQITYQCKGNSFTYLTFLPFNRLFKTDTLSPDGSGCGCLSSPSVCLRLHLVDGVKGGGIPLGASGLALRETRIGSTLPFSASSPVWLEETSFFSRRVPREWSEECCNRHHLSNPRCTPRSPVEKNVKVEQPDTRHIHAYGKNIGTPHGKDWKHVNWLL